MREDEQKKLRGRSREQRDDAKLATTKFLMALVFMVFRMILTAHCERNELLHKWLPAMAVNHQDMNAKLGFFETSKLLLQ